MKGTKLSCGCVHNATHWLVACPACDAAYYNAHRNAGIIHVSDMRARDPDYAPIATTHSDATFAAGPL